MTRFDKRKMERQQPRSKVCTVEGCGKPKRHPHAVCEKHRAEYQHDYYLAHQEKAKEYQQQYNREHKKKREPNQTASKPTRKIVKTAFTVSDLQNATGDKLLKRLTGIVTGERELVRVK
jgi:hypothetical protein